MYPYMYKNVFACNSTNTLGLTFSPHHQPTVKVSGKSVYLDQSTLAKITNYHRVFYFLLPMQSAVTVGTEKDVQLDGCGFVLHGTLTVETHLVVCNGM